MRLLEIRELDGPNPYLPGPAIKVEMELEHGEPVATWADRLAGLLDGLGLPAAAPGPARDPRKAVGACVAAALRAVAVATGESVPGVTVVPGDDEAQLVVAFPWSRRDVAVGLAGVAASMAIGSCSHDEPDRGAIERDLAALRKRIAAPATTDDAPELLLIGDGPPRVVAITGTNGKTTTTRLVAHLLRSTGQSVGWSSTSGIYINGEEIETGDWSGPSGARHLLRRDDLDWAILETARGGILRRGLAWDGAHVTAMTNVSADHLGDFGVWTTGTLAQVKGTVLRATRPDGWAVINADDPLVYGQRAGVRSRRCFITQRPLTDELGEAVAAGATVVALDGGEIVVRTLDGVTRIAAIADVPLTFGGAARHMVENVLCAAGIALGCGLSSAEIADGLASFTSSPELNPGRLNVYAVRGATYLADYAHNEAGLAELIHLARTLIRGDGRLWLVIGTAGDRSDETFRALGRMAAEASGLVVVRDTPNYLRGRAPGEVPALMTEGVRSAGGDPYASVDDEISAIDSTVEVIQAGDVVAFMASDNPAGVASRLAELSQPDRTC